MKKLLLIVMSLVSIMAHAYDFEVDGIYYNVVSLSDLTCEVTYNEAKAESVNYKFWIQRGDSTYFSTRSLSRVYPSYSDTVAVPEKVNYKGRELTVTGVGKYAFLGCVNLTSLSLPSSITDIAEVTVDSYYNSYAGAFDYCNIKSFTAGNPYTLQMFDQTYAKGNENRTTPNLRQLVLSKDFTGDIGVDYGGYGKLVNIKSLANVAPTFSKGSPFNTNQFLNVVVEVDAADMAQYKQATIWSSFWSIYAISDNAPIPDTLGDYHFQVDGNYYYVESLSDLTCKLAKFGAKLNSNTLVVPEKVSYKGRELTVTAIGKYAFSGCNLKSITLPYSVTSLSNSTFSGCELSSLFLPSSITYIGSSAFGVCDIESLTVGNNYILTKFTESSCRSKLKMLTLSEDFSGVIAESFVDYANLETLRSMSPEAPQFSDGNHFTNIQYLNLSVFVPEEHYSVYQSATVWKDFWELTPIKSVTNVSLDQATAQLEPGQTLQLVASVNPADAYDTSLIWSSSNPEVASVSEEGLVTAITKGETHIKVSANGGQNVTAECVVNVDLLVKELSLSDISIGLEPGESKSLSVTILPEEAFVKEVNWSSDNAAVASVDNEGKVTAHSEGVTYITVSTTDGSNLVSKCKVTVANLVKEIIIAPSDVTLKEGTTTRLAATVSPDTATYKDVVWSSSNDDIATVNQEGKVTAVSAGVAQIVATASDGSGISGVCNVSVTPIVTEYNGICYQRNSVNTLKVVANDNHPYAGDFFVPKTAIFNGEEMTVTGIGEDAFAGCSELTRLVLPNSLSKIASNAFKGCNKLVYVMIANGSTVESNLDELFADSPIEELYIGSDHISFNENSRLLGIVKAMTLGNTVSSFPPVQAFNSIQRFVVEEGETPIIEPEEYCSRSMIKGAQQTPKDPDTKVYYRFFFTITYTHLSPIMNALEDNTLNYLHIGREVNGVETDKSLTQEKKPTSAGSRYQEYGYVDEYNYSYNEIIVKKDYNRYPAESIILDKSSVGLNIGETIKLHVIFTPGNTSQTDVTWSSSDESVASVDIFGNVSMLTKGQAVITATTTDGTNLSASCTITYSDSGIEDVLSDFTDGLYIVYNLQGILVLRTEDVTKLQSLPTGIYIVNGKKIAIR